MEKDWKTRKTALAESDIYLKYLKAPLLFKKWQLTEVNFSFFFLVMTC